MAHGLYTAVNTFTARGPAARGAAWAHALFLGEDGYRRIAATVMDTKARIVEASRAWRRATRLGREPELWAVAS